MNTTAWSVENRHAARSTPGYVITKKIISDCVNLYDIIVITLGSLISHLVYLGRFSDDSSDITSYLLYGFAGAIASSRAFHMARIYDFRNLTHLRWQLSRVTMAWSAIVVGGLTIAFLTKFSSGISRGWLLLWFASALYWMVIGRIAVARLLYRWSLQGKFLRRVAVITTDREKNVVLSRIEDSDENPVDIIGVFGADDVSLLIRDVEIDEVVVALPPSEHHRLAEVISQLSALPVDVNIAIDLPIPATAFKHFELQKDALLGRVSDRPLKHWNALHKRMLDLVVAVAALVALSPFMAVIALLIKLDSRGPVLFRQRRDGYGNQRFLIYKFRSLRVEKTDQDCERSVTKNDDRVTRIGRILRKTSLDELPQLFNVIRGDMSIVGPRPHAVRTKAGGRYFEDVVTNYIARHRVKPGITGWAQVNGWRGETDSEEKILRRVEYDIYYIEHWSLWLDIKIIFKTLFVVFERTNAY